MANGQRDWLDRLVSVSVGHFRLTVVAWVLLATIAGFGVRLLHLDTGTSAFLDRISPEWIVYQNSLRAFGGDEVVVVAFEGERRFDRAVLSDIKKFTLLFEEIPGVRRVDSIASVPVILARDDGSISLQPALSQFTAMEDVDTRELSNLIKLDRIAPGSLVSDDEMIFAINVILDSDIDNGRDAIVARIGELLAGRQAWVSGVPVFRTAVNSRTQAELSLFIPITVSVVAFIVFVAFRRTWPVVVCLGTSGIGVWFLLGVMGAFGVPLSLSTMILPSVLLALGSAYVMHVLVAVDEAQHPRDVEIAVLGVARPVGLSGLTTAISFLAMSTVRIEAISQLGIYGAIGVLSVLAATLSLAPAMLAMPLGREGLRVSSAGIRRIPGGWIAVHVLRARVVVLVAWFLLLAFSFVGISRLMIETDIVLWFSKETAARNSYEEIRNRLSGITPVNVVVTAGDGRSVIEEPALEAIFALSGFAGSLSSVGKTLAITDPLIQIHSGFEPNSVGELPINPALVSQYLLLLESVEQISDVLTRDRKRANILLRLRENGSKNIVSVREEVDGWWAENGPAEYSVDTTGVMFEFARAEEEIARGQIRGLALALLAISSILFLIFRSPRVSIAALIPNFVPLVIAYGFMGFTGVPLDAATICIGSLALGIAVDDTIHITSTYSDRVKLGDDSQQALVSSLEHVAPALVFSTAAIGAGFLVLGLSDFILIRNFGLVTSVMVVVCLVADFTLLLVLLKSNRPAISTK